MIILNAKMKIAGKQSWWRRKGKRRELKYLWFIIDFRFLQMCWWGCKSRGTWQRDDWCIFMDISGSMQSETSEAAEALKMCAQNSSKVRQLSASKHGIISLDIRLYFLFVTSTDACPAKWWIMSYIRRNVQGCGCGVIWDTTLWFSRRKWGNPQHTRSSVRTGGFRVQIWVQDLLNSKQFSTRTSAKFIEETTLMMMMMMMMIMAKVTTSTHSTNDKNYFMVQ